MTKEELVKLLKGDLQREWQHMAFYLSASSLVSGLHREEYKEFLFEAAQSEMQHVKEFQDLILGLDGKLTDLDLEFNYPNGAVNVAAILCMALNKEQEVTENYVTRIAQAEELGGVDGKWVAVFLEDQLKHSREDADNIKQILRGN